MHGAQTLNFEYYFLLTRFSHGKKRKRKENERERRPEQILFFLSVTQNNIR